MKKLFIALLFATLSFAAKSSGLYDAIYQHPINSNVYLTLIQNGNTVIVTRYQIVTPDHFYYPFEKRDYVTTPTQLNTWELFSGTIVNNRAVVKGRSNYESCEEEIDLKFDASGVNVLTLNVKEFKEKQLFDISCFAIFLTTPFSPTRYLRIF